MMNNYDRIEEIEVQIDELKNQIQSIRQKKISGDNIYQLLLMFDKVYYSCSEVEQKEFMKAFIEKIELYPEKLRKMLSELLLRSEQMVWVGTCNNIRNTAKEVSLSEIIYV